MKVVNALCILSLVFCLNAAHIHALETGPVNPLFKRYMEQGIPRDSGETLFSSGEAPSFSGVIPSPLPPEIHKPDNDTGELCLNPESPVPDRFDWRDPDGDNDFADSILTSVRDQADCGSCWAFASYGALEGGLNLQQLSPPDENDYSENHLIHTHGFDPGPCDGGNIDMSMAYLARYSGPVPESLDPYRPSEPNIFCEDCGPRFYVDNMITLPGRRTIQDNLYIKQALMAYGPLYTTMYIHPDFYDGTTSTHLNPDFYVDNESSADNDATNHAILIVGWDDTIPVPGADAPGVFIAKNSYGTGWGASGYFYISYADKSLARYGLTYFKNEEDSHLAFDKIYQYDPLGMTAKPFIKGRTTLYGANVFHIDEKGWLKAIGLFIPKSDTRCQIQIFKGLQTHPDHVQFTHPMAVKEVGILAKGYHTVKLDEAIPLQEAETLVIQARYHHDVEDAALPVEQDRLGGIDNYSSQAVSEPGQSYYSTDGVQFKDLTAISSFANSNICIKALVKTQVLIEIDAEFTMFSTSKSQQLVAGQSLRAKGLHSLSWINVTTGESGFFTLGSMEHFSPQGNGTVVPFQQQIPLGRYANTIDIVARDSDGLEIGDDQITITRLPSGYDTVQIPVIQTQEIPVYEEIPVYKTITRYCYRWDPLRQMMRKKACGTEVVVDHYEKIISHYDYEEVVTGYTTEQIEIWED